MTAGLYIHIPFCRRKCLYCDFYSLKGGGVPGDYVLAVCDKIKRREMRFDTVYFGGGTPSLLTPEQVEKILSCALISPGREITLEANPDSVDGDKLDGYRRAGINRLSFGVQTVFPRSLERLGRLHTQRQSAEAFALARNAGFKNISGDIMLALGGYTCREMRRTADFLKSRGAVHISAYMLKIEEGTPYRSNPPANLPDEDRAADFYLSACRYLEQLGYRQYEISNFSLPGCESRHNQIYWNMGDYLGIGPGAHSCINGKRFYYKRDLEAFMRGKNPIPEGETDRDDYIMLSLRLTSGLDLGILRDRWDTELPQRETELFRRWEEVGLCSFKDGVLSLTPKGFLVENSIASEIMSSAEDIG